MIWRTRAAGEPICPFRSQSAIGSPQTAAPANRPIRWRYAGTPWVAHRFVDGIGGNDVWLYEVIGGGHSWAEKDMDTPEEIWRFFSRFVK